MPVTVTVSQLNAYLKDLFEADEQLCDIAIRGEISNYTVHTSGHHYFTLKDKNSSLRCVMFRREASRLSFRPQTGMAVLAGGRIAVYEAGGQYQLYATWLEPDGIGAQYLALEELKKKMAALGYFDAERKRPLPTLPQCVGVVTSPTGAAWHDIQKVAKSRWPGIRLQLFPALVQGEDAPSSIVAAIAAANAAEEPDVLIVGRGGGSMEDLWCFNDEAVALAILHSQVPVVSAVGHEIDFTLADFVADVRAATPSAAAELVVPDSSALLEKLNHLKENMQQTVNICIEKKWQKLAQLQSYPLFQQPQLFLEAPWRQVETYRNALTQQMAAAQRDATQKTKELAGRLHLLDPIATLSRGYALCQKPDGTLVTKAATVTPTEEIITRLSEGSLRCRVLECLEYEENLE